MSETHPNRRLEVFEGHVEERFGKVDEKLDTLARETTVKERFDKVDQRFEKVDERLETLATEASVKEHFEKVDHRFDKMDERFDRLDTKIDRARDLMFWLVGGLFVALVSANQLF